MLGSRLRDWAMTSCLRGHPFSWIDGKRCSGLMEHVPQTVSSYLHNPVV